MRRAGSIIAAALSSAISLALAASCSSSPPEIVSLAVRLIVLAADQAGARDERLSVFVSVADAQGVGDIEYLYVVHDGDELCWTLGPDDWRRADDGSSVWLGSNSLDAPGPTIPRGDYRLVMVDKAGERAERNFTLSAPETSAYAAPSVRLSGATAVVATAYPTNTAFFFDAGGNVTHTAPIAKGSTELDSLWPEGKWRTGADYIAVYGLEPKAETGFFSWKARLPD
ncbi:MAG: hypothetical protein H7A27_08245 [Spirochaetaceae bacterium]|nr:hypothetical protein [Spirochaetaceae bacterium]HPE87928.1 hypothetical protein [Spirochaetales bacterium]